MNTPDLLIVAGPTCAGKSALAMQLAERLDGVVINADAMQLYRELRVITARPSPADEARVPHALYGVRPAAEAASVAWWCGAARALIGAGTGLPILCGGTGLYLDALLHGLAEVPPPTASARAEARALLAERGAGWLHARLAEVDPQTAARLRPSDGQRLARGYEVWRSTGRGLAAWQASNRSAPLAARVSAIVLAPDRASLREAIGRRWLAMLDAGALAEVAALRDQRLDPALPAMRAHGVPELCAYLDGVIDLGEAGRRAIAATGRYTRRQSTWLRHHALAGPLEVFTISARYATQEKQNINLAPDISAFLSLRGLTRGVSPA